MDDVGGEQPDLSKVRKFGGGYPIYYAGDEVAGHPLEEVFGEEGGGVFIYGDCEPEPTGDGETCNPPLQIHNYDICDRPPPSFNKGPLYDFRGAKARGGGMSNEDPMEIFTGRTTVKIGAEDELTKAAAAALRTVRQAWPPSRLPPPAPGSLQGKLPCPDKPGD